MPRELHPMRVNKIPKGKEHMRKEVCEGGEYFGQLKKDGYWYEFEKDINGECFLWSRVVSKKTGHLSNKIDNVPHIREFLNERLPEDTIIIGETYYPNKKSKDVTQIMGCDSEKAIMRQDGEYGHIHYYIHDILYFNGKSLLDHNNLERYLYLKEVFYNLELWECPYIELAQDYYKDLDHMIDKVIDDGEEGMVLKKKTGKYIIGKKPAWNMLKFKCEDEADVIISGYNPPTREYNGKLLGGWAYWSGKTPVTKPYAKGWIGSLQVSAIDKDGDWVEVGNVSSGLTDSLLEEIKHDPSKYIGQPISVSFMNLEDNKLRHPRLERIRDDLNLEDCTLEKIFG